MSDQGQHSLPLIQYFLDTSADSNLFRIWDKHDQDWLLWSRKCDTFAASSFVRVLTALGHYF